MYEFVSVVLLVISLPMLLISAFYHIKERKKRISEFRAVVNNSLDGILLLGLSGEILHPNRAACSLLGYSSEELMKSKVSDLLSEDSEKKFEKAKSSLLLERMPFRLNWNSLPRDNSS